MAYDAEFDQTRLDQLAQQHLGGTNISGRILFFGDPGENRLDLATWQLDNDEDYEAIKGSDFKLHMMELLDTLQTYRAQHSQPNASQGVVHVDGQALSIEWLPKAQVEALRGS
ncbi:hypothetical protein [Marinobacter sp.]|uniref:hypothetical protein n=1 Tax=Marinobacter sp. TaxID=50741 RepID=UPI00356691F4